MHIFLTPENEKFVSESMNELQCSGSDFVNSLISAVRGSSYTREYTIELTKKDNSQKKVEKKIHIRRTSNAEKYEPLKL